MPSSAVKNNIPPTRAKPDGPARGGVRVAANQQRSAGAPSGYLDRPRTFGGGRLSRGRPHASQGDRSCRRGGGSPSRSDPTSTTTQHLRPSNARPNSLFPRTTPSTTHEAPPQGRHKCRARIVCAPCTAPASCHAQRATPPSGPVWRKSRHGGNGGVEPVWWTRDLRERGSTPTSAPDSSRSPSPPTTATRTHIPDRTAAKKVRLRPSGKYVNFYACLCYQVASITPATVLTDGAVTCQTRVRLLARPALTGTAKVGSTSDPGRANGPSPALCSATSGVEAS